MIISASPINCIAIFSSTQAVLFPSRQPLLASLSSPQLDAGLFLTRVRETREGEASSSRSATRCAAEENLLAGTQLTSSNHPDTHTHSFVYLSLSVDHNYFRLRKSGLPDLLFLSLSNLSGGSSSFFFRTRPGLCPASGLYFLLWRVRAGNSAALLFSLSLSRFLKSLSRRFCFFYLVFFIWNASYVRTGAARELCSSLCWQGITTLPRRRLARAR